MEEFNNLPRTRRPRQYTYRGSYRRPGSIPGGFNPAADVLSAIEEVEGKFVKRRKDIDLFEQQAMQRRLKLQEMVDDTKTMDENPFKAKMTQEFSQMVDDLYKADIESFDGDRTGYMEKANNAQKVIGDFQKVVGLIDADVNEYKDKSPAELKKLVLRSQFMGKDGMKREDYLAFLNDPSKMGMRIQNGELIITNDGKDLFNGTRYLNSKKDGYSLVEYGNDYTKEINAAAKDAMQGVGDLATIRQYEKLTKEGKELKTFTDIDYRKAVKAYRDNLVNSDKIDALVNESTFQRYTTNRDVYNADKHFEETKTAIIDDLVKKQFPTAYRTKQVTSKLVTPKDKTGKTTPTKSYKPIVSKGKELSSFIKNPGDEYLMKGTQFETYPGGIRNEKYRNKVQELKEDIRRQLNDTYSLRRLGQKDVIQDFEIAVDEKTGEIKAFPMVQKVIKNKDGSESEELVIQRDFGQGIVVNDNSLFKFDKILGGVDPKTTLSTTEDSNDPLGIN
jgi:hypothetical protein|tara:strand:+ start:996 stop:2504 length:1509 start_codon:yes stop_codon:yes gene_type:complete